MKGFTLLEMLVVVLILGILASVAMPQYQRAVEKSRAVEAVTIGRTIIASQNRSLDAFPDVHPDNRAALDVTWSNLDGTWQPEQETARNQDTYETALFVYRLDPGGVTARRQQNGRFEYELRFYNKSAGLEDVCNGDDFCNHMADMGFARAN